MQLKQVCDKRMLAHGCIKNREEEDIKCCVSHLRAGFWSHAHARLNSSSFVRRPEPFVQTTASEKLQARRAS